MKPPAWIAQLAREGLVAFSRVDRAGTETLDQLCALQLIAVEVQGNRRRVIVRDRIALTRWVAGAYPDEVAAPVTGRRAANIARARQSKAGVSTHDTQPLILRWFSPDPTVPWADLTHRCGIVGIMTNHISELDLPEYWTLLTVENWESFVVLDYQPQTNTILAVFTGGNIADSTLRVLAALQPPPVRAIHFGDYDWSGLAIFRRIRTMIPILSFYVPDDVADLFRNFAGYGLLEGQIPLVPQPDDPAEVQRVIALIEQHNAGLEQEIVAPPRF
ncbi:MAG: Wadjet anti-phage system protein JetD domain-containing protein [Chloroflexales bacterium]